MSKQRATYEFWKKSEVEVKKRIRKTSDKKDGSN